jgi:pimeloyl-ACP methyl ester carboxylesterase
MSARALQNPPANNMRTRGRTTATVVAGALGTLLLWTDPRVAGAEPLKNIVLVHGALVDGSGWREVYDLLTRDGYTVSVVQQPLTGLSNDVAATRRILASQPTWSLRGITRSLPATCPPTKRRLNRACRPSPPVTVFNTPITSPAWKLKPSWYMVAQADRIISPDLERTYAARAHSHTVEIGGASHSVDRSHPKEVATLIDEAAQRAAPQ